MAAIVLGFILFCGSLVAGGTLGSLDLKQKIEKGDVVVKTEQVTVTTVTDAENTDSK
jgi:hypothetical protein